MYDDFHFRGQREDEEILLMIKQHVWVFAKTGFIILLLANLVVLMLMFAGASGYFSYALFAFVLGAGLMVGYKWFIWSNGIYIITNQRLIKIGQDGLFHRTITEIELDRIQDISSEMRGPLQMFLNFGTLHIATASSNSGLDLLWVPDPYDAQQKIVKALKYVKQDIGGKVEFKDSF